MECKKSKSPISGTLRWEVISVAAPLVIAELEVQELGSEGGDEAVTTDKAIAQKTRLTARSTASREPHSPSDAHERSQRIPAAAAHPMSWPVVNSGCVHATVERPFITSSLG